MINTKDTIYNYFRASVSRYPERTALIFGDKATTYAELLLNIDKAAETFSAAGIKKGDCVSVSLPNIPEAVYAFYALSKLGAVISMIHPLTPPIQMKEFLDTTGSSFLYSLSAEGVKLTAVTPDKTKEAKMPADTAVLLHSGGTTGIPKTIVHPDRTFNELAARLMWILCADTLEDTKNKRLLSVLPFFHGYGLGVGVHSILCIGGTSILMPKFSPEGAVAAIKNHGANFLVGVPTMFGSLLNCADFDGPHLSVIEHVFCGADTLPPELAQSVNKILFKNGSRTRVYEGFGLTEAVTITAVNTERHHKEGDGSVGHPLPGYIMKAYDNEKDKFAEAGVSGELCVLAPSIMTCYLGDTDTTAQTLKKHKDGNVWLHTGDYGYVDADGYVFFKQRIKRILKVSGVAVFPSEIEAAALASGVVVSCCAVGIKNERTGTAVRLHAILKENADEAAARKKITDACAERVIRWAVPQEIVFEKSFPLTPLGKIDYRKLEQI